MKTFKKEQQAVHRETVGRRPSTTPVQPVVNQTYSSGIVNTLGTSMDNFTKHLDQMAADIRDKADVLFRDLIEPLDMYYKHYNSTCNVVLLEC